MLLPTLREGGVRRRIFAELGAPSPGSVSLKLVLSVGRASSHRDIGPRRALFRASSPALGARRPGKGHPAPSRLLAQGWLGTETPTATVSLRSSFRWLGWRRVCGHVGRPGAAFQRSAPPPRPPAAAGTTDPAQGGRG